MKNNQFAKVGRVLKNSLSVLYKTHPYDSKKVLPTKKLNNQLPYSLPS